MRNDIFDKTVKLKTVEELEKFKDMYCNPTKLDKDFKSKYVQKGSDVFAKITKLQKNESK